VYDITDKDSFSKMSMWVKELRQQCGSQLPIVIVGNKSDLEQSRQIKLTDAEDYAKQLGVQHFSASARTGFNVKEVFKALTESKFFIFLTCCSRNRARQGSQQAAAKTQDQHTRNDQRERHRHRG
jgi:GTPase SAR1 family protein